MKIIEVTISPAGEISLQTKGFAGAACQAASRQLEQALGIKSRERLTTEFHTASVTSAVEQRQGP